MSTREDSVVRRGRAIVERHRRNVLLWIVLLASPWMTHHLLEAWSAPPAERPLDWLTPVYALALVGLGLVLVDALVELALPADRHRRLKAGLRRMLDESLLVGWSLLILIVLSIVVWVMDDMELVEGRTLVWVRRLDIALLGLFFVEYVLRYIAAEGPKIRHVTRPLSLIDAMALLPLLRIFRVARFLRLFRVARLARLARFADLIANSVSTFSAITSEHVFDFLVIGLFCLATLTASSLAIYHFESPARPDMTLFDAFWWSFYCLMAGETVMDLGTAGGRAISMVVLTAGLVLFSLLTATMAASFSERLRAVHTGAGRVRFEGHIVLCGWRPGVPELVEQLRSVVFRRRRAVVVVADRDLGGEALHRRGSAFVRGDPASAEALSRANLAAAHAVIILQETGQQEAMGRGEGEVERVAKALDYRSVLTFLTVDAFVRRHHRSRPVSICVEVRDRRLVRALSFARAHAVVPAMDLSERLIAHCVASPGLSLLVDELSTYRTDDHEIYPLRVGEASPRRTFAAWAERLGAIGLTAVALAREGLVRLAPCGDEVEPGSLIFVLSLDEPPADLLAALWDGSPSRKGPRRGVGWQSHRRGVHRPRRRPFRRPRPVAEDAPLVLVGTEEEIERVQHHIRDLPELAEAPQVTIESGAKTLELLAKAPLKEARSVVLLIDETMAPQHVDGETALLLIALRQVAPDVHVVAEVLHRANTPALEAAGADDVVCVSALGDGLLVNAAHERSVLDVFRAFLQHGPGPRLVRVTDPESVGQRVDDVRRRWLARDRVLVGLWKAHGDGPDEQLHLNPDPRAVVGSDDTLLLLGEPL